MKTEVYGYSKKCANNVVKKEKQMKNEDDVV